MNGRVVMNSRSLQENFPEVYRGFFSKCELVVSAPVSFYWFGDHADRYGQLAVKQKLPLRVYVGLASTDDGKITFGDNQNFVPSDQRFRPYVRSAPRVKKVVELLQSQVNIQPGRGIRLHSICEAPIGCGLGAWGATAAALAVAIGIRDGWMKADELERWASAPMDQLADIKGSVFDRVFRLAWKIESLYAADAASGSTVFTALTSSSFPVIYSTERRSGGLLGHPLSRIPSDLGDEYQLIDDIRYWGARLHSFFKLRKVENWPLDFGLIYSGSTTSSEFIIRSTKDLQLTLAEIVNDLARTAKQNVPNRFHQTIDFLRRADQQGGATMWESYLAAMDSATVEGLIAFRKLFGLGYTDQAIEDLFIALGISQSQLTSIGVSTPSLDLLQAAFAKEAVAEDTKVATKITGAGKGGDLLFVTPLYSLEHSIDSFLRQAKKTIDKRIWLDYASWIDGFEEQGALVEQNLAVAHYSTFVSSGAAVVKSWSKTGSHSQIVGTDRLDKVRQGFDLFLDPLEKTISIRGQLLTSKELHSQKVTMVVLQLLLSRLGKNVPSSELPASSYADRTTMQGKIIGPLCEYFKTKTGKKLPLTISGSLNKNFTIKLEVDGLTIGTIDNKI